MALQVMDGFEFAPNVRSAYTGPSGGTVTATTGRDGVGKSLSLGAAAASVTVPLPSVATVIVGLGMWVPAAMYGVTGTNAGLLYIVGDAGATTHLTFQIDGTGHLYVRRGTSTSGVIIATATTVMAADTWHWVEIKASINDTTGICIAKVDGVEHINFTGDTKNAGTAASVSGVILAGTSTASRYDDLVVCDATGSAPFNDFFGEKVIRLKAPNNNGAVNAWLGSDGNSTDNYQLVDEIPVSTTDYTASSTPADRDLYALTSVSGMASVDAIQNVAYVAKSDAGARSFRTVTRNVGTNYAEAFATVPAAGLGWTYSGTGFSSTTASTFPGSTTPLEGITTCLRFYGGSSGTPGDRYAELTINYTSAGTITFADAASSEGPTFDFGKFAIDGVVQHTNVGGTAYNWTARSYSVAAGTRVFRWTYTKDGSGWGGIDSYAVGNLKTTNTQFIGIVTGPTVPLSTTYLLAQGGIELTDPSAAAWTTTNVNTIQAGVEVV